MDGQAIRAIQALLERAVGSGEIAGAVGLVANGNDVGTFTSGFQDIAARTPMRRDTIFRIMSMTKPILAAAALMLVEEDRLDLDAPVDPWLPELANRRVLRDIGSSLGDTVPAKRAITLRDLLTMRIGLGMIMARPGSYPIQTAMAEAGLVPGADQLRFGPDEFMARLGRLPLAAQPGERWLYHTPADVTAVLISRVVGRPLDDILRERIFAPLGMHDTGFHVSALKIGRLATGYMRTGDGLAVADPAGGGDYETPPAFPSELVSTVDDYLAFAAMLAASGHTDRCQLLDEASVAAMFTDHITPEQKAISPFAPRFWDENGWGFGGAVTTRTGASGFPPGSYGWAGGYGTSFMMDPSRPLIAVLLSQRLMTSPDDMALAIQFQSLAAGGHDSDRRLVPKRS
jgi:CubicO group peptidase (beta-lactamase class C family)